MDIIIIVLIVTILLGLLLVILYFFKIWPFSIPYLNKDPRTWKYNPNPLQREFDYSPYGTDQPVADISTVYSYFINLYCSSNNADSKMCTPYHIPNWYVPGTPA